MRYIAVKDEEYEWFKEAIESMHAIYADEDRCDWFDADDTAKDVADMLESCIDRQEEDMAERGAFVDMTDTCPKCHSADIEGDRFDGEGYEAWQVVRCNECGYEFMDVYKYVETIGR